MASKKTNGVSINRFQMFGPEGEQIAGFASDRGWSTGDALRLFATVGAWVMALMPQMMVATVMAKFSQEEK